MVSAKGLVFRTPETWRLVETCSEDAPLVVQLFGAEPDYLQRAVARLLECGYSLFDLNAGCPVKKVVKTGAGAALLQDVSRLVSLVRSMTEVAGAGRVGVKIRLGWSEPHPGLLDAVQRLQDVGAGWIALHPRTVQQGFSGRAAWEWARWLTESAVLPVIGSGDLFSAADGLQRMAKNEASGLMFARGALYDPSIFRGYLQGWRGGQEQSGHEKTRQPLKERIAMARRHSELCRAYLDDRRSLLKMRTVVPRYLKGFAKARSVRPRIVACRTWQELASILDEIEGAHSP
jgi:tRNA-dihydrouridine synthase B